MADLHIGKIHLYCSANLSGEQGVDIGSDIGSDVGSNVGSDVGSGVGSDVGSDVGSLLTSVWSPRKVGKDAVDVAPTANVDWLNGRGHSLILGGGETLIWGDLLIEGDLLIGAVL